MSYFGATGTPVLDFLWRLFWVSKPPHCGGECNVHFLRSTSGATRCRPLDGQHAGRRPGSYLAQGYYWILETWTAWDRGSMCGGAPLSVCQYPSCHVMSWFLVIFTPTMNHSVWILFHFIYFIYEHLTITDWTRLIQTQLIRVLLKSKLLFFQILFWLFHV